MGEGLCCHLERERGERVRAFEGVASGGGNSDLWARVDTIVLDQACDANVQERGLGECVVFVGGRAGEGVSTRFEDCIYAGDDEDASLLPLLVSVA